MADDSVAYKWTRLEDLSAKDSSLARPELDSLADVWREQKGHLSVEAQKQFLDQLQRQWAIETGVLERIYSLDRGITQVLIERGIDASLIPSSATDKDPNLVAAIITDQKEAVEALFDFVKGQRTLSTSYIKELHALLTRHQETSDAADSLGRRVQVKLERGVYKICANNPLRPDGTIHEYCPPEHVASETDRLVAIHREHEKSDVPPEIQAAWLHHRFTQIHPFQDGNGRVARALASLVFIKAGWFPLTVTRDDREEYIAALEAADQGDLAKLVNLFAAIERQAFVNALGIASDVHHRQQVGQVIEAAREVFEKRQDALKLEWEQAKSTAVSLQDIAWGRFNQLVGQLDAEIRRYSPNFAFYSDTERNHGDRGHYFRHQIVQSARKLGYFANTSVYAAWVRLVLRTETQAEILLSFHGVGHEYRGVLVCSVCFFRREEIEEGESELADLVTISDRVFQINYREKPTEVEARFRDWLEDALIRALETWRTGL
ncbi:MAG: filamentation induced by cAMP protein fic [Acidobacteria bacterium]|nr:MAG: filamentation induced by cAMP protein fic [Acidobacteriota bacterium]